MIKYYIKAIVITYILCLFMTYGFSQNLHGGANGGSSCNTVSACSNTINKFTGGADDGSALNIFSACPATINIFAGSAGDGAANNNIIACSGSINRFLGGSFDGSSDTLVTDCSVSTNLFAGGAYDGESFSGITISASPSGSVCSGTSLTFSVWPPGGSPTYQWVKNGSDVSGETNSAFTSSSLANNDVITCVVTFSGSCVFVSNPLTVSITNAGTVSGPTPVNVGAVVNYTTSGTPGGTWSSGSPAVASVDPVTGVVTALSDGTSLITYSLSSCGGLSASQMITVNPNYIFQGGANGGASGDGISACSGSVILFAGGNGDGSADSFVSACSDSVIKFAGGANDGSAETFISACSQAVIKFAGGADDGSTNTVVTVCSQDMIMFSGGAKDGAAAPVVAGDTVAVSAVPSGAVCAGTNVTFTATPGNGLSYQWYNNGAPVSGATGSAFSSSTLADNDSVYCEMTSGASCSSGPPAVSNIIIMSVNSASPTVFNVTGGGAYCSGGTAVTVDIDGSQTGVNYQLMYISFPVLSPVAGTGSGFSFGAQIQAGSYTVVATDATSGCQNTMSGSADVSIYNCAPSYVSVAINTSGAVADSSAILDVSDTVSGVLFPRLNNTERDAVNYPDTGLIIYNISTGMFNFFNGSVWSEIDTLFITSLTGSTGTDYGTAINTNGIPPANSAMLDVSSTTKGVLIPRTLPGAIYGAADGCIIYNVHTNKINYFNGAAWIEPGGTQVSATTGTGSLNTDGCAVNLTNANSAPSAILDVSAQNKCMLLPRLTNAQRNNISPATGLLIYNTDSNRPEYYNGSKWYGMQ